MVKYTLKYVWPFFNMKGRVNISRNSKVYCYLLVREHTVNAVDNNTDINLYNYDYNTTIKPKYVPV